MKPSTMILFALTLSATSVFAKIKCPKGKLKTDFSTTITHKVKCIESNGKKTTYKVKCKKGRLSINKKFEDSQCVSPGTDYARGRCKGIFKLHSRNGCKNFKNGKCKSYGSNFSVVGGNPLPKTDNLPYSDCDNGKQGKYGCCKGMGPFGLLAKMSCPRIGKWKINVNAPIKKACSRPSSNIIKIEKSPYLKKVK